MTPPLTPLLASRRSVVREIVDRRAADDRLSSPVPVEGDLALAGVGQRVDVPGDCDAPPDGRLLSVAEIQHALRQLRVTRPAEAATTLTRDQSQPGWTDPRREAHANSGGGPETRGTTEARIEAHSSDLHEGWVAVVAAHAGAGASSMALAIADAAAETGRTAHVVDVAAPARSGLAGAADAELGLDPIGAWRRGGRGPGGRLTIHLRASNDVPVGWPGLPDSGSDLVVVDLGLPTSENLGRLAAGRARVVVVCRATVPGIRRAGHLLDAITAPVAVAVIGRNRWPREVAASLGPRLRDRRAHGAVVCVPADPRLAVTGLTSAGLPRPVARAGRALLELLDTARASGDTVTEGNWSDVHCDE